MRIVPSTIAAFAAFTMLFVPSVASAQGTLAITNYQFVSEQRSTRTEWFVTYRADVVNTGLPRTGLTATVSSLTPATVKVVAGQNTLHFGSVPTGTPVTSTDTFTILVDRSFPFEFANLQWVFLAPTANPGPNQTVTVGTTVTLNGSGSTNTNGSGGLTYSWAFASKPATSTAVLANANTVASSFTADVSGNYVITLTVSNGIATDSANVKVSTRNSPPLAKAGPNQSATVGSSITLDGSGSSDVDGDPLTYFWTMVSKPATSSAFITNFRSVAASFVMDKPGSYVVQLVVNDGKVDSDPSTVTISNGNTAPVARATSNSTTANVGALIQLSGSTSTDVDGDPLTYKWSLTSVPAGSTVSLSSLTIVNPTFMPDVAGSYVAQLVVNDGKVDSVPSTVTISSVNQPPTANAGANQSVVAHGTTVTLNGSGTDPQNLPLTYSWSLVTKPAGSTAVLSSTTAPKPTFVADLLGDYVAQLIVNNGSLSSAPSTVTITNRNTRPVANAGVNQSVLSGATVSLDGIGSADADGDPLTYSWTLSSKPAGSTSALSAATSRTPTFLADLAGTYIVQLIVNDGFANSDPSTMTVTVAAILPPVANAGANQSLVAHGTTITLDGSGTDSQNLPLTYLWTLVTKPAGSTAVLSNTTVRKPTFVADRIGDYVARLIVNNGTLSSTPSLVTITNLNTRPVANAGVNQSVLTGVTVSLDGIGSADADGDPLTYSWTLSGKPAGSTSSLSSTTSRTPTFFVDMAGTYSVQLIVNDGFSTSDPSTVTITAGAKNILLTPSPLNILTIPGVTGALTLSLSTPAPAGGVTVNLTGFDTAMISLSKTQVIFDEGASSATITVTPLSAGTTSVTAAGGGTYQPATVTVTVTTPSITIALDTPSVKTTYSINGTVTLSSPAPTGGVNVALSVAPGGRVTFNPPTVTIAAGSSSASFSLTGVTEGTGTITGSSTGFTSGTVSVVVSSPGNIALASGVTVGPTQSATIAVTLSAPAPTAVTINLTSSDTSKATVTSSVTIAAGQTTPATQPQVTGVAFGSATISASGGGYVSDSKTVTVGASLGFGPTGGLTLVGATPQTLNLTLSAPAPAGGLVVNLAASPTGIVTIPATATFAAGATTTSFSVTGVAIGSTTITASSVALNVTSATASVTVQTQGAISLPAGKSVNVGKAIAFQVTLSAAAPAGGATVTLSASNGNATISPTTVIIPAGATQPVTAPQVTGVTAGSLNITATSPLYTATTQIVTVTPAIDIIIPATLSMNPGDSIPFNVTLANPAPSPNGLLVDLVSSDPSKASLNFTGIFFNAGQTSPSRQPSLNANAAGTATITATSSGLNSATTVVTIGTSMALSPSSLQITGTDGNMTLTLSSAASSNFSVTLNSSNTGVATVPSSLPITIGTTNVTFKVTAVGAGATNITATASGYPTATASATVVSSGVSITTTSLPAGAAGAAYNATVLATGGVTPYTWTAPSGLPGGLSIAPGTGVISGTPTASGSTSIVIQVADANGVTAQKTLVLQINSSSITVSSGGTQSTSPSAAFASPLAVIVKDSSNSPIAGITVTFTVTAAGNGASATLSSSTANTNGSGIASVTATANATSGGPFTVSATIPGVATAATFSLTNNGAGFTMTPSTLTIANPVSNGVLTLTLANAAASQVNFTLSSSNPAVATVPSSLPFSAGTTIQGFTVTGASAGTTVITASAPGFGTVTSNITVNPLGTITLSANPTSIKLGQAASTLTVTLNQAAPTGGVTINFGFNSTKLGMPTSMVIPAGATTGTVSVSGGNVGNHTITATATGYTAATPITIAVGANIAWEAPTVTIPQSGIGTTRSFNLLLFSTVPGSNAFSINDGISVNISSGNTAVASVQTPVNFFWDGSTIPATRVTITINGAGTAQIHASGINIADVVMNLTVVGPIAINTTPLPSGTVNTAYAATVTATGGTAPYSWSATGLPTGLTMNSATGVISGTPTVSGSSSITVNVSDASNPVLSTSANFTLVIANTPPVISTSSLADGAQGVAYSATMAATGGTGAYKWSATGLPAGLTIAQATGIISGTPTAAGTSQVVVTVTDSAATPLSATKNLNLTITAPQLVISTSSLVGGKQGVAYSATVAATGGTGAYNWSATGLPAGVTIAQATGIISGTPTVNGPFPVVVTVADSATPPVSVSKTLSLAIAAPDLVITNSGLTGNAVQGVAYTTTMTATGGTGAYNWSATGLPAGVTIAQATGIISGNPTVNGTFPVVITVTDSATPAVSTSKTLSLVVAPPALAISTSSLPAGVQNVAYTTTVAATGGTGAYNWSATGLPANLTINATSGVISGTPAAASTNTVVVTVSDSAIPSVSVSKTMTLLINTPTLTLNTTTLANGAQGVAYSATTTATGGTGPYSWSATGLPAGLTIAAGTGIISGTPTANGTFSVVITVTDSATSPATDTKTITLTIAPALVISTTTLANGTQNVAYSATVAATGGTGAYNWSATGLPTGLTIATGTGIISGTTSVLGAASVVVTVTDSATPPVSVSKTLSLAITAPALVISTTTLANGQQGVAYSATVAATGGTGAYNWSATSLPVGLTIAAGTGIISGTPTANGAFSVVVTVADSATPPVSVSKTLSLTIAPPALVISTTTLANGTQSVAYSATVAATGGTGAYSWSATGLPAGLTIAPATGVISGTTSVLGAASVVVTVADSATPPVSVSKTLSLTIAPPSLVISTSTLPNGQQSVAYSATVVATGGTGAYNWSATGLPTGLTMAAGSGIISGAPTANGTFQVVITVTDSATPVSSVSKTISLVIGNPPPPATITVSSGNNQSTKVNTAFPAPVAAIVKDANGLPVQGITVTFTKPASGASGTFSVNTAVTDVNGIATATLTANTITGAYNVTATAGALTVTFAMTNTAGNPATIAVSSGSGQSTLAGSTYGLPLKAVVTDSFNNLISGVTVTFTAPGQSVPSVVFAGGNTAVTDASGVATSGIMTANTKANGNPFTVSASVTGVSTPANFLLTNLTGPPAALTSISGSNQQAEAGKAFNNPLQTLVTDAFGNALRGYTVTFTGPGSGASATVNPNTAVTDNGGVATSGVVTANATTGTYNVTASISGVAATGAFALTNTSCVTNCPGVITAPGVTIGKDLQAPILITFTPPIPIGSGGVPLTITSTDPAKALVGGGTAAGKTTITATMAEGSNTVSTFVQALVGTGTVDITLSAPGYLTTTATISLVNSGFVLTGPNGLGQAFSVFQGSTAALTVNSVSLTGAGAMSSIQQVRGGLTLTVPVTSSLTTIGTITGGNISFPGGTDTGAPNFVASGVNTGTTTVAITTPNGFTTPATGASLAATVSVSCTIPPSTTVGQGLEKAVSVSLCGPAPAATAVVITSNDPSKVLYSLSPNTAGSSSITLTIPKNQSRTPDFYVQATAASGTAGTVTNSVTATGFAATTGTITLAPTGLRITSPGGVGATNFSSSANGPLANIIVETGRMSGGFFAEAQSVSGGNSVTVGVSSSNTTVGSFSAPTVTIANGNSSATALFSSNATGTTMITASATNYTPASVTATVTGTKIILSGGLTIGKFLQMSDTVILNPAPSVATQVTVTSSDAAMLKLSATSTGAGAASITLNFAAGQSSASIYVQAQSDNGSATYTASAPGYPTTPATFSSVFQPSGIVILTSTQGSAIAGSAGTTINASSNPNVIVYTAILTVEGVPSDIQPLAGGSGLQVAIQNNHPEKATLPCPTTGAGAILACTPGNAGYTAGQGFITVPAGTSNTILPITLLAATDPFTPATLTITTPGGFTEAVSLTTMRVTVQ